VTYAPLKYGFVNIPARYLDFFPRGPRTITVEVYFDNSKTGQQVKYQPQYKRLFGLTNWYRAHRARFGDKVVIQRLGKGTYRLNLEQSKMPAGGPAILKVEHLPPKEKDLYRGVKEALTKEIRGKEVYLEVTAFGGKMSERLEHSLDTQAFFFIKTEKHSPDVMGYVIEAESSLGFGILSQEQMNRIIAEIKDDPISIADFYQAKRYGEVFDAKYSFLISNKPMPEEVRRFVVERPVIQHYQYTGGQREIIYAEFNSQGKLQFEDFED